MSVVVVTVVVGVVVGRADIVHLVDATALRAALDRTVLGDGEPLDVVGVGGVAGAAEVAVEELDDVSCGEGGWGGGGSYRSSPKEGTTMGSAMVPGEGKKELVKCRKGQA